MLDLNKLAHLVDEALNNETGESMTLWLNNQRISELSVFLGCGDMDTALETIYSHYSVPPTKDQYDISSQETKNLGLYTLAA